VHSGDGVRRRSSTFASSLSKATGAVLGLGVFVAASVFIASPASAQDALDCSQNVVDTTGRVDVIVLQQAINDGNPAATIVVRSFDQVAGGDLVSAIDEVVATCFAGPNNSVRSDVVVLGHSADDRLSDVLVGSALSDAVPDPEKIRVELMVPLFAEGDLTGGFLAAIEEINGGLAAEFSAPETEDTDQSEALPETPPAAVGEPGGTGQSWWAIIGGLVAIAACGAVFLLVNRQRRLSAAREDLERSSAPPLARLGVLRERDSRLRTQAEGWSQTTTGQTLERLKVLQRESETVRHDTDRSGGLLSQAVPDGVSNAGQAEIARARDRVMELSRALDAQDEALDRFAAFGAHIDHLRVALPAKADLLDEEIDEAHELAEQREAEGWSVQNQRVELDKIGSSIDSLDFDVLELDLLAMSEQIESDEAQLFAVGHYLQTLPSRVASLKKWNTGLEEAADLELRRVEEMRRGFAVLATTHASDSWQWAADYPELATDELEKAEALQDIAIPQLISTERFDEAGVQLDAAGVHLIAADHLLDQVDDLMVDLERASEEAPGIVLQCRAILADLNGYVTKFQADLEPSLVGRPPVIARAIDGLEQELRQVKPNYLRVAETGDRLNRQIDELFVEAEDQHTKAEALRRELTREYARANRALARAKRSLGWEFFPSSDGEALDRLRTSLESLPDDAETAVAAASAIADDALRIQERIIARRRRRNVWVSTGGGGWNSGGGGWSPRRSTSGSSGRSSRRSRASTGRSFSSGGGSSRGGRSFGGGRSSGSY
jgi:hypothetical protein